jgi:peptidoglycan/xylan/chitin deacetylase (PgdA/CDA1 family)
MNDIPSPASPRAVSAQRVRAVVHLDLDGMEHIRRVHGWPHVAGHDDVLFDSGLREALDFFERAKVRATLFVIAEDLEHPPKRELLAEAAKRGHEIASHSLTHRRLTTLDRQAKRREIADSRERLATALDVEVRGFRAPEFDIDREAVELLDDAGYAYDSSLFPAAGSALQLDNVQSGVGPYRPLAGRRLIELPLPRYRPLPTPFHPSYSLVLGMWYFRIGMLRFHRTGAPFVLLFHLTDFADPLPRAQLPGWLAMLYTLSHLPRERKVRRCQEMLDFVRRHYEVVATEDLLGLRSAVADTAMREA